MTELSAPRHLKPVAADEPIRIVTAAPLRTEQAKRSLIATLLSLGSDPTVVDAARRR